MTTENHDLIERKVAFSVFVWTISILAGAMLAISGYLFSEVAALRTAQAEGTAISDGRTRELAAKLEAEKEKNTAVLVSLAEIKGDIKLIKDQLERTTRGR
jgi:hypothetical protein